MGVVIFGINGGFLAISPSNTPPVHCSSISMLPIVHTASSFVPAKKSWDLDGRKPRFSRTCACAAHATWICPNPITGTAYNSAKVRKGWIFEGRSAQYCPVRARASGDVEAHLANVQLIEKELEFSPMFNDYVKVMESVRMDRSKNPNEDVVGVSPKKRSMGKVASSRVVEKIDSGGRKLGYRGKGMDAKNRKHGDGGESWDGSGWGLVERILEKRTSGRKSSDSKDSNERTGHSLSHPKKGTVRVQNGREFGRIDELRLRSRSKDAMESGSSKRFNEIKRGGSRSKELYDKNVDVIDNGRVDLGRKKINRSRDESIYKNSVEMKTADFNNSKILPEKRSSVGNKTIRQSDESLISKSIYESDKFREFDMSKKMDGSENNKAIWEDETPRMNERKAGVNFLQIEPKRFEKDTHGKSQRHVRLHDGSRKTENLVFTDIGMRKWSSDKIQLDKVPGSTNAMDFEDRAAFRTYEEFTDVRNRPRVLRMELEQRIHKLAKWLNATDVNMPEWQFSKIMHSAKIKFTEHSILRVVQILGAHGNWKRALQVVEWLQTRERFTAYKSRYIYTSVLDVLGKAKRPVEALNIFYAMRQELSSYPDLAAYHCIAVTLGQAGLMKELFDVIDCMRAAPEKKFKLGPLQKWDPRLEPDLVVYNAVLNACVQQKQWEGAFWVLQQLKQQNIQPTNTTYGLIMETMLACKKYNLVHEVFRKVEKSSIPNALNYKVLVNTLWREGKTDEAVQAVKDMERRGVVGSASLYYDLARCLCSAGRCKEALQQINKICKVAKKPLVVTYTGLIQACLDSGNIENGTYIFNQMHKFCSPNSVTCNIMLKSYIEHGMYNEAKDLFWKILDGSHQLKSKVDSDQKAIPDKFTFNTMMEACASTNNWDNFESTYKQMLHHGYHFDTKRHLRMVLDASRAGKIQVVEATWDHLIRFGRAPPPPIIQESFCIKLQEDDHLAALSFIRVDQESGMHAFSKNSWLKLLLNNSHRLKKDTIYRLSHELSNLVAERDHPHPVYQNLLSACREIS